MSRRFAWGTDVVYTDEDGRRHAATVVEPVMVERFHFIGDTRVIEVNGERLIVQGDSLSPVDPDDPA